MKLRMYRIVTDNYLGYEAQVWRAWFPFWVQIGHTNTFKTVEEAENFIKNRGVVKYVDV